MSEDKFDEVALDCPKCRKKFLADIHSRHLCCEECRLVEVPKLRAVYKIYGLHTNLGLRFLLRRETVVFGLVYSQDVGFYGAIEEARFRVPAGMSVTGKKSDIEYNLVETWF